MTTLFTQDIKFLFARLCFFYIVAIFEEVIPLIVNTINPRETTKQRNED